MAFFWAEWDSCCAQFPVKFQNRERGIEFCRFATLMTAFHDWRQDTKRSGCLFTKNYLIPRKVITNIHLHLKDIFIKPLQCLDFCIRLLEFNIYNKTNYMHRKNKKFTKNYLIPPTTENEVFSPLILG